MNYLLFTKKDLYAALLTLTTSSHYSYATFNLQHTFTFDINTEDVTRLTTTNINNTVYISKILEYLTTLPLIENKYILHLIKVDLYHISIRVKQYVNNEYITIKEFTPSIYDNNIILFFKNLPLITKLCGIVWVFYSANKHYIGSIAYTSGYGWGVSTPSDSDIIMPHIIRPCTEELEGYLKAYYHSPAINNYYKQCESTITNFYKKRDGEDIIIKQLSNLPTIFDTSVFVSSISN